jgi:kanamycin kinase
VIASAPTGPVEVPGLVRAFVRGEPEAVWENELGGLTFRDGDRYLKWNPLGSGVDLEDERARIAWAAPHTPVPEVLDVGRDDHGQVLVTRALAGRSAVLGEPAVAARAVGEGLRAMHEALPVATCPWVWREGDDDLVVCHGDPCVPNTIVGDDGGWTGHVDLGRLGVANRWADLAVASENLDLNFGEGWQPLFFDAYGIARDEDRIHHYRALWNDEP